MTIEGYDEAYKVAKNLIKKINGNEKNRRIYK